MQLPPMRPEAYLSEDGKPVYEFNHTGRHRMTAEEYAEAIVTGRIPSASYQHCEVGRCVRRHYAKNPEFWSAVNRLLRDPWKTPERYLDGRVSTPN